MPKISTERVRTLRNRQKTEKPAPKSATAHAKQNKEKQKALKNTACATVTVPEIPTVDNLQSIPASSTNPLPSRIRHEHCIFCKRNIVKGLGQVIRDDEESLKKGLLMYKEFLKNSEMNENIEALPQLYYHYDCRVQFFNRVYNDAIEGSQAKCRATKLLHDQAFKEICTIIKENVIEKGQCYFLKDLIQEYTSFMKKFAEDGCDYYFIFSKEHFKTMLCKRFANIKMNRIKSLEVVMPKNRKMDDEFRTLFEEKKTLQKAALILRNKMLNININDTIDEELRVSELLTYFYTTLLSGSQPRRQSIDCCKKVNSMAQDAIHAISNSQINTANRATLEEASENLSSNREVIDLITLSEEVEHDYF